jgi:formylglycine-generating enzyme required for sulfatase activity
MFPSTALPATISSFRLDTYEVTIGRFRQFVNAAGLGTQATPPASGAGARTLNGMASQGGWDPTWNASLKANTADLVAALKCDAEWTDAPGINDALPVHCLTWYEAFAFCVWDGGFLPTQAEWNFAAAGGSQQRAYPWSSPAGSLAIDCAHANYDAQPHCVNPPGGTANRVGSESPEGDGAYGQADLGGNVWEWTLDYGGTPLSACNDCATLTPNANRIIRGGSWYVIAVSLRTARPDGAAPTFRGYDLGVRCARAL